MTIGGLSGKKIVSLLSFFALLGLLHTFFLGRHFLSSPPLFLEVRVHTAQLLFKPMQPRTYCKLFSFLKSKKFRFYSHNQNKSFCFFVKNFLCFFENILFLKFFKI